jgi:hypothetical protein
MSSERLALIDSIVGAAIDGHATPSCQVLVARHGMIVYDKAFGHPGYESSAVVSTSDIYDLASCTKLMATLPAVMKLYDQGKIDLDRHVSHYLPEMKRLHHVTVRDLLMRLPSSYKDTEHPQPVASLHPGQPACVEGYLKGSPALARFSGKTMVSAQVADESGVISCRWFNQPWMKDLLRPLAFSTRRMSRFPPSHSTSASSRARRRSSGAVKSPSTMQFWAPAEIRLASPFAPISSERAPRRMLFPAPVCPVIMPRPSGREISRESIST